MAHRKPKPKQEEDAGEGAPLWIISFADMMSLLMAFFVMLSTFSGFGPSEAEKLQRAVRATLAPNYGGWWSRDSRTAVGFQAPAAGQLSKGSEKPTLQDTEGRGLLTETPADEFRNRKVFLVESKTVFWGAGLTLSRSGRDFLDTLAAFAARVPGRIVISEEGPGDRRAEDGGQKTDDGQQTTEDGGQKTDEGRQRTEDREQRTADSAVGRPPSAVLRDLSSDLGVRRATRVLNYLAARGIPEDRCSVGVRGMSPSPTFAKERLLEIVLLDTSVYQ